MKNKTLFLIVGILAIVIVVGIVLVATNKVQNPLKPGKPTPVPGQEKDRETGDGYKYEAQIAIGKNGFVPAKLTIKVHTRVYWKNEQGSTLAFQILPSVGGGLEKKDIKAPDDEFGTVGKVDASGGYAYSFHRIGTFRYYNALNPRENGEIEVVAEK